MENIKPNYQNKFIPLVLSLLILFTVACSDKKNTDTETYTETEQVVAVEDDTETVDVNTSSESTPKVTYTQPKDVAQAPDKVVLDARSTSFKNLDKNNDQVVNRSEFYDGLYAELDADGNDAITEQEFTSAKNDLFTKNKKSRLSTYKDWDNDGNGEVSKEEFRNKLASVLDVPDNTALAQNLYIIWDTDNDKKIEKLELDNVIVRFDEDSN